MKFLATAIALLGTGLALGPASRAPEPTKAVFTRTVEYRTDYLVALPDGYAADETKRWPLLVFLHGAGERGDDLDRVAIHWPPKIAAAAKIENFPFVVVAPQCKKGTVWSPDAVLALVDHAANTYRVDPDRIYLTGLSMGGFGTWETAAHAPERFAAIVPVCGGGSFIDAWNLRDKVPVWAFHGGADKTVPPAESKRLVEAIQKFGGEAKLTIYDGVGHNSWDRAYAEPELWTWLLAHHRGK